MSKGRHKTYPEKERDGEIKRLKDALKRKDREIEKLKSELRTYDAAFQKNIQFLKGKTKDLTLTELLEGAKKEQNLKAIEGEKEMKFKELEEKWKCHKCGIGIMKMIVYSRPDGAWYIRSCTNKPKCSHRTEGKPFHEGIEGIK